MILEDAVGKFSFTAEGMNYFESLSPNDRKEFLSQLKADLAKSIPVDINRLGDINCC